MDDPHLLRVDLAPGGGLEVALAARVGAGDGFLAVLAVAADGWRVLNHLGPAVLGEPTSLSVLNLPGRTAALVLTDLADQMAGAFCRREACSILALRKGALARIWGREIEIQAYWNREWSDPPGYGWLRLSGEAQYEFCYVGTAPAITVTYRNTLAEAPQAGRLPEEGSFVVRHSRTGEEVYRWDPALGLFILGYGRTRVRTTLQRREGGSVMKSVADLAPGESVAILGDEQNEPRALLDDPVYLRVYAAGRTGLVEPGAIEMAGNLQVTNSPDQSPAGSPPPSVRARPRSLRSPRSP